MRMGRWEVGVRQMRRIVARTHHGERQQTHTQSMSLLYNTTEMYGGVLSPGEKFISLHHSCGLDGERVRISCWNCPFESLLEEGGHHFRLSFQLHLWTADSFFVFFLLGELRGGRTEMGLALKYLLHKGFPWGQNCLCAPGPHRCH